MIVCPLRSLRSRHSSRAALAALSVTLAVSGCSRREAAAPVAVVAEAGGAGTRWSTVDLVKIYAVDRATLATDDALKARIKKESGPVFASRAVAAGAELVWDLGGESAIGISPVLFAEPALALPGSGAPRVFLVDMATLYNNHPKTLAHNAAIRASDQRAQAKVDTMNAAGDALVAGYRQLPVDGAEAAAVKEKAREQIKAKQRDVQAYIDETRLALHAQVMAFRGAMLRELADGIVATARARGATLVLDTSGPSQIGVSTLVYIDPALRPAPGGGVREGSAAAARVHTVNLARLYDRHPKTLALNAQLLADKKKADKETFRLNQDGRVLVEHHKLYVKKGDSAAAAKALEQATAKQSEVQAYIRHTEAELKKRLSTYRTAALAELAKTAGEVAHRAGAQLLLDTSGPSHLGVSYLVYAAPALDLTEAIAKEMQIALAR